MLSGYPTGCIRLVEAEQGQLWSSEMKDKKEKLLLVKGQRARHCGSLRSESRHDTNDSIGALIQISGPVVQSGPRPL